jgi:hypothetical protein
MLVEKGAFRRLILYLGKTLKDEDIPHRTVIGTEIIKKAEVIERIEGSMRVCIFRRLIMNMQSLIIHFVQDAPGKHSFTLDIYTKKGSDPFLSLTDHRITVDPENPHKWKLECDQIGFEHVPGSHTGANVANVIMRVFDRFDIILDKVCYLYIYHFVSY